MPNSVPSSPAGGTPGPASAPVLSSSGGTSATSSDGRSVTGKGPPAAGSGHCSSANAGPTSGGLALLTSTLKGVLSSLRPSVGLGDLDVCLDVHGQAVEALLQGPGAAARGLGGEGGRRRPRKGAAAATTARVQGSSAPTSATWPGGGGRGGESGGLGFTCLHKLARVRAVPGDEGAWAACLAAEWCYQQALCHKAGAGATGGLEASARGGHGGALASDAESAEGDEDKTSTQLRRKLGDAANELGKLLSACAGALVVAPPPPVASAAAAAAAPTLGAGGGGGSGNAEADERCGNHRGEACVVSLACARLWFSRSLREFEAIGDESNRALVLCNLASVSRLKLRALSLLQQVSPDLQRSGKRGVEEAVELCRLAHEALKHRDEDPITWDHASQQLAMAYLCLGVQRRQDLLQTCLGSQGVEGRVGPSSPPSPGEERRVVEPLELALETYMGMSNAGQAAACHYQIGQYYAKVLPVYLKANSNKIGRKSWWEVGQQAICHFLAARTFFGTMERGATFLLLTLDLSDLYVSLSQGKSVVKEDCLTPAAEKGQDRQTEGRSGSEAVDYRSGVVGVGSEARGVEQQSSEQPFFSGGDRVVPCLEGALGSLLEARVVLGSSSVAGGASRGTARSKGQETPTAEASANGTPGVVIAKNSRVARLLEGVKDRLPRVLLGLVKALSSMVGERATSRGRVRAVSDEKARGEKLAIFKDMYRTCLVQNAAGSGIGTLLLTLGDRYTAYNSSRASR
ncbi:unnamed protein product [Discosporangium mesarthrocarpum]